MRTPFSRAREKGWFDILLTSSSRLFVASVWTSGALFGLYILSFYGATLLRGHPDEWNRLLPGLYGPNAPLAILGMAVHLALGAVLLFLGPLQLIGAVRRRTPRLHRRLGYVTLTAAALTGLGGLLYILAKGTIGGPWMSVGFGIYGAAMIGCAAMALAAARSRQFDIHRAWAIRLYALIVGSWLYRMDYGLWLGMGHGIGHTRTFDGPFDRVMVFWFYVPNILVAELFIRARGQGLGGRMITPVASGTLVAGAALIAMATWFFLTGYWGPNSIRGLFGSLS